MFICLFACLFVRLFVRLFARLSVCLLVIVCLLLFVCCCSFVVVVLLGFVTRPVTACYSMLQDHVSCCNISLIFEFGDAS